jgi:hypothetical protein
MNIALISEGVTDRPIIEATLISYFSVNHKEVSPMLNSLQPKGKEPGGWTRVLFYCGTEEFRKSFDFNDYVIIQIDSDKHAEKGFDVADYPDLVQLIQAIHNRIIQSIGDKFYQTVKERILFAISMDSIECWLLPFYATTVAHKSKVINCCQTLNNYLRKHKYTIDCNNSEGSYEYYQKAAKLLSNKKDFFTSYYFNESLEYFVDIELNKIKAPVSPPIM